MSNNTGQSRPLRERFAIRDIVAMPMKTSGQIAVGTTTGSYNYRSDPDPHRRHTRTVEWGRSDVPAQLSNKTCSMALEHS
jgi:restriction system protein